MATTAPVAAAKETKLSWTDYFQERFNKYVDLTSQYGIDVRGTFTLKTKGTDADPVDSAMKKTMKVFFMLLSSIVLAPIALLGAAYSAVKACVCSKAKEGADKSQAPPADGKTNKKTEDVKKKEAVAEEEEVEESDDDEAEELQPAPKGGKAVLPPALKDAKKKDAKAPVELNPDDVDAPEEV